MHTLPHDTPPSPASFWKVAGILTALQIAMGFIAIALTAYFSYDHQVDLIEERVRAKVDLFSDEIQRRSFPFGSSVQQASLLNLSASMIADYSHRFSDPIHLLDEDGSVLRTIQPAQPGQLAPIAPPPITTEHTNALIQDKVKVHIGNTSQERQASWAIAPIKDGEGARVGGILIQPLTNSASAEFNALYQHYYSALLVVFALSIIIGVTLSAFFTLRQPAVD